jgi:hypothetical protein
MNLDINELKKEQLISKKRLLQSKPIKGGKAYD